MAVIEAITFDVKPGRQDELITTIKDLKGLLDRVDVGLTSVRLVHATIAGPNAGRVVLLAEYADLPSWGKSIENENADPDLLALVQQSMGSDAAFTTVGRTLYTEISL